MTSNPAMTVPVGVAAILGTLASRLVCKEPVYAAMSRQFPMVVEPKPVVEPEAVGSALQPSAADEEHTSDEVVWWPDGTRPVSLLSRSTFKAARRANSVSSLFPRRHVLLVAGHGRSTPPRRLAVPE